MIVLEKMVDLSPLYISLKTAIITIIITFFLGLFLAKWTLNRKHNLTKIILDGIFTIPLVLPPTVMGFFLLMIFGVNQPIGKLFLHVFHYKITFSFSATVIAAVVISFPLMYRSAKAAMEQIDHDLIDSGRTLGMSENAFSLQSFYLKLCQELLVGVFYLCKRFREFGATAMLAGNIVGKQELYLWRSIVKSCQEITIMQVFMFLLSLLFV
ncbi:MAG: molybdate ABC transporter permease subunit [Faecalibacillus faecis]